MNTNIETISLEILEAIKESKSILLHCHPSPDPDSVGSVLAMKMVLENHFGKKVVAIRGDSDIPMAFGHFPEVKTFVDKDFSQINLNDFDLLIILDSASPSMISRKNVPVFPLPIKTVIIDHHSSNDKYADINLVEASYPSTAQVLFDVFKIWKVKLNHDIAVNLFIGMYTDTGGFKYAGTTPSTLEIASLLAQEAPDFNDFILKMENSRTKEALIYNGLALSSFKTFLNDKLAISKVSFKEISKNNISSEDISSTFIANILLSIRDVNIAVSIAEDEPLKLRLQFRSKDSLNFDVSKLAVSLGGGGHKMASGARLSMSVEEAEKKVVEMTKIIYNL